MPMSNLRWEPGKLSPFLSGERVARVVELDLCGIDVGRRCELRTVEMLLLRPRLGQFYFDPEDVRHLRDEWNVELSYDSRTDCAIVAVSSGPSDHSDGCAVIVGLTERGRVARIDVEGPFASR